MAKRKRNLDCVDERGFTIHHPSKTLNESSLWRVGIISDTHGKRSEQLREIFGNVHEIWHAGDIAGKDCSFESASSVLNDLRKLAPVSHVVRGNVDKFAGGLRGFKGFCEHPPSNMSDQFPEV
jgi:predicted phosphodiesterase